MSDWQWTASRREMLVAMLGAPIAAQACRAPTRMQFDGSIIGQDVAHAHILRDPSRLATIAWDSVTATRTKTVIVGSGPTGLSCAWRLAQQQQRSFVILELEPRLGGTSTYEHNSTSAYPWGAHYVPAPAPDNARFIALLRAMDLLDPSSSVLGSVAIREEFLVRDLDERVWLDGRWHENLLPTEGLTAHDRRDIAAFQREIAALVQYRDSSQRRAFSLPTRMSSSDPSILGLDQQTMDQWMQSKHLTAPRLRWLVNYACRDDYGLSSAQTSAWAGLFYFASRQDGPNTSARELLAFPEGNGRFVKWFLEQFASENARTSTLVVDVFRRDDGLIETRAMDLRANAPLRWVSETAVLGTAHFVARKILRSLRDRPSPLDTLQHSPWMVANLTLRDRPRVDEGGLEMAWDNVLYDSPSLGYVCATHQSMRDYGPTVLTWYLPFTGENPTQDRGKLFSMSYQECASVVMADLVRAHPELPSLVTRLDVMRWGHAMIRPTVSSRARIIEAQSVTLAEDNVFVAHTERAGVALFEEALEQGWTAADNVMLALRARQQSGTELVSG